MTHKLLPFPHTKLPYEKPRLAIKISVSTKVVGVSPPEHAQVGDVRSEAADRSGIQPASDGTQKEPIR